VSDESQGRVGEPALQSGRVLAPLTSLGLGGPARHFLEASSRSELLDGLRWAQREGVPVGILGGGSNLVIADTGFEGLVIRLATRGRQLTRVDDHALLEVQAGEPWDDVVELALSEQLAGVECLTGIPGSSGATPIQNVGAYGQEVSQTIDAVEVLDRESLVASWWAPSACGFGYRHSRFKRESRRWVVLAVRFRLTPGGTPSIRYGELARALEAGLASPSLREVAQCVRGLRAQKSMLLDPGGENGRSAGSFFTNPVVASELAERVKREALVRGLVKHTDEVPTYPAGPGQQKLAAGWLIEQSGIHKGLRRGAVGISTRHALALVHHGGGSTSALLALADEVRRRVRDVFGVELGLEPVLW
jgi:UDP-N-acetylmuramate dehydrogenase